MQVLSGLELELHTIYGDGTLAPVGFEIAEELGSGFSPEIAKHNLEVITAPHPSPLDTISDLEKKIALAKKVASKKGAYLIISAIMHNEEVTPTPNEYYERIWHETLGYESARVGSYTNGTHINLSLLENKYDQYNLYTAVNPILAITNSTPVMFGFNGANNHRLKAREERVYKKAPEQGRLWPYFTSDEEYLRAQETIIKKTGLENNIHGFDRMQGLIRFRKDRIEIRTHDSTRLKNISAVLAAYHGLTRLLSRGATVSIGTYQPGNFYSDGEFNLPCFDQVKSLNEKAIAEGIRNKEVNDYVKEVFDAAKKGLSEQEQKLLTPGYLAIQHKRNISDDILDMILKNRKTSNPSNPHLITREEARILYGQLTI